MSVIPVRQRGVLRTAMAAWLVVSSILIFAGSADAANPVPYVSQPLVPDAVAPGGPGFTLTVNGTGFVFGSVVRWNGSARATHFVTHSQLTATILASDIATAGTALVTVVNPGSTASTSDIVFFPITVSSPAVALKRSDLATGASPNSVGIADFNEDGKLDLAVTNFVGNTVSIFQGNGDGSFQARVDYATGSGPDSVLARDFNGDGKVDLAVRNYHDDTISVLLGNGDGTFRQHVDFPTGSAPQRLTAGDFNEDGKLDLAVKNSYAVFIHLGNGDGTFQTPIEYPTGPGAGQVTIGDFNRDGHLDLAVANNKGTVSILLGNGDGTFQSQVEYPVGPNSGSVTTADFNGDGKLDLALNHEIDAVSILLGNGDGTFQPHVDYATGAFAYAVAVADLNGDGKLDLVLPNSVLLGNGDGTFQPHVDYPTGVIPVSVNIGDFNSDGKLDLAIVNNAEDTVSVLLQTTGGPVVTLSPATHTFASQAVGTKSASQKLTLSNTGNVPLVIQDILDVNNADFAVVQGCGPEGASLAPSASCSIWVSFTPTQDGTRLGTVKFIDNAANSPQIVSLKGAGIGTSSVVEVEPSNPITFATQKVATTSAAKTVLLINQGNAPLSLFSFAASGDFAQTNNCPASLAPAASCNIFVTFKPTATGTRTGWVAITDNAPGSPQISQLSGTGTVGP